jgi:hypothetical protein
LEQASGGAVNRAANSRHRALSRGADIGCAGISADFSSWSDIQPRIEACGECASFPHTNQVRYRFDDLKLMSATRGI